MRFSCLVVFYYNYVVMLFNNNMLWYNYGNQVIKRIILNSSLHLTILRRAVQTQKAITAYLKSRIVVSYST